MCALLCNNRCAVGVIPSVREESLTRCGESWGPLEIVRGDYPALRAGKPYDLTHIPRRGMIILLYPCGVCEAASSGDRPVWDYRSRSALTSARRKRRGIAWRAPRVGFVGPLLAKLLALPRDREVLFICASGNRLARATEAARAAGLSASNVSGGMIAWAQAKLPTER